MARLLRQLEEIRGDYDRLEERYNALAGTLRTIANFSPLSPSEELIYRAQRALAFAGDPEIDR